MEGLEDWCGGGTQDSCWKRVWNLDYPWLPVPQLLSDQPFTGSQQCDIAQPWIVGTDRPEPQFPPSTCVTQGK